MTEQQAKDRFRFQQVANEIAAEVSFGTLRELRYHLQLLEDEGHGLSLVVDAFTQASDLKASRQ